MPRIASNLLSVHKLCLHNNCSCYFDAHKFLIQDIPTGRILYKSLSKNGLYLIYSKSKSVQAPSQSHSNHVFHAQKSTNMLLWHNRLGHPRDSVLNSTFYSLVSNKSASLDIVLNKDSVVTHYRHCLSGKMCQLPFKDSVFKSSRPLELVHSDVWGPAPVISVNDYKYYLVFVDDFTKFTWLYLLKFKSDVFTIFKYFQATVENMLDHKIKILRTDCGGEFTSNAFNEFCKTQGITHQLSCPHTPQQNGVAERKHRHLVECSLTMFSHSHLPISYWSYAVSTTTHIINRLSTPILNNLSP